MEKLAVFTEVDDALWKTRYKMSDIGFEGSGLMVFIGQQLEVAAAVGFHFSGIEKPVNQNDNYGLRYAELVVQLVKAVQEQQALISDLLQQNEQLKNHMQELKKQVPIAVKKITP